jgi:serine/threonine-protein kinase
MKEHGIVVGARGDGSFFLKLQDPQVTTVNPGWTNVRVSGKWGKIIGATLSGELIFGERVYGRMTQARDGDETFPVCIELRDEEGGRGLIRSDDGGPNSAKVFSIMTLEAVDHFE